MVFLPEILSPAARWCCWSDTRDGFGRESHLQRGSTARPSSLGAGAFSCGWPGKLPPNQGAGSNFLSATGMKGGVCYAQLDQARIWLENLQERKSCSRRW